MRLLRFAREPEEESLKTFWLASLQEKVVITEKIRSEDWN